MTGRPARMMSSPSRITGLGLLLLIGVLLAVTEPTAAWPLDPGEPPGPTIHGRVSDVVTLRPVPGARIASAGRATVTDTQGRFELNVPPGTLDAKAAADGYTSVTAVGRTVRDRPVRIDFELPPLKADEAGMRLAAERIRADGQPADDRSAPAASDDGGAVVADEGSLGEAQVISAQAVVEVPDTIRVLMPDGEIVEMETDEYLKGVVPAEMGYVFSRAAEALKAQAIAARTYAAQTCLRETAGDPEVCEPGLDANVDTTTRTQVWRPVHYEVTDAAVIATHGQVARYGGQLIPALYFARARLRTLNSEDSACCGGRSWPYLRSVGSPDPFAARRGHGAGMSQEGAATLGSWGAEAVEIVSHYYTDATVDPPLPTPLPTAVGEAEVAVAASSDDARSDSEPRALDGADTAAATETSLSVSRASSISLGAGEFTLVPAGGVGSSSDGVGSSSSEAGSSDGEAGLVEGPVRAESDTVGTEFPFMALAVQWFDPGSAELELSVRTSRDGETWSDWTVLEPDDGDAKEPPPDGEHWSRLHIARGQFAQLGAAAPELSALDGDSVSEAVPDSLTLHYLNTDPGPTAPSLRGMADDSNLVVIPRSGWGADESLRFDDDGEIWPVDYTVPMAEVVHHTVTENDPVDAAAIVRSIYYYHAVTREWGDIGYNFLVDHRGNVYEGRHGGESGNRITQGGHALQYNTNTIGVAVLGTYTAADQRPSPASIDGLVRVLAHKGQRFGIEPFAPVTLDGNSFPYSVLGHRDVLPGHTVCPGDGLYSLMPEVRTRVDRLIDELWQPGQPTSVHATATATRLPPTATRRPPATSPPSSATPAPPPTNTPPPAEGCRELVVDGGFEDGSDEWVRSRAHFTSWDAHSGDWAMFVGLRDTDQDDDPTYASAWQLLDGPFGGGSAGLSFAARTRGFAGDRLIVRVLDEDGAVVALGGETLPLISGWTEYSFDLTADLAAIEPQTLRVYFAAVNDGDGRRSYLRVDDVSLVVCDGATSPSPVAPTASPSPPAASATASATLPAPPPTYPTPSVRCGSMLRDGGFESPGIGSWQLSGDHPAVQASQPVRSGAGALRLGLIQDDEDEFGYAAAAQALSFPPEIVSARLTLWSHPIAASPEDTFVVELRRTSDGLRQRLFGPEPIGSSGRWAFETMDLDPEDLEGTMELYIAVLNRGQAEQASDRTAIALDDVDLVVCFESSYAARYVPRAVTAHP